jgi:hypothetical protein
MHRDATLEQRTEMDTIARWGARLVAAAMLGATAGIHADLYHGYGYRHIHVIGWLFLLLVIGASILCLAVLAAPKGLLALVAASGAITEAATFIGLLIFTHHTVFGFQDSSQAPHYNSSLIVEAIGFVVLAGLTIASVGDLGRRRPTQ